MAQTENDTCRESVSNGSPVFLWVEHVDPRDGIGFASAATRGIKGGGNPWFNLLDCVVKNLDDVPAPIPIGDPAKKAGVKSVESFKSNSLHCYKLTYGGIEGRLAFNVIETDESENRSMLARPRFDIEGKEVSPNIYILSGHGCSAAIQGEDLYVGNMPIKHITAFTSLNVLILPGCSIAGYGLANKYFQLYKSPNFYFILGYRHTYPGGAISKQLMEEFVVHTRKGMPIIDAWILANNDAEKRTEKRFPWSVIYAESCRKHTISHIEANAVRSIDDQILCESHLERNPTVIELPKFSLAYVAISGADEKADKRRKADIENEINKEEIDYRDSERQLTINNKLFRNYFILRNVKRTFAPGQIIFVKFCVMRPDWPNKLSLKKLCKEIVSYNDEDYKISLPKSLGENLIRIDIHKQTESIKVLLKFNPGARKYTTELATHAEANGMVEFDRSVISYLIECHMDGTTDSKRILIDGSNKEFPENGPKSDSWWRECLEVQDLTEYSCKFCDQMADGENA